MTSTGSSPPTRGAMNLRPPTLFKTLAALGIFICVVSYSYWSRLVSIPANFIHRQPLPSQDFQFDNPTDQNWIHRIWQTSKLPVVAIGDEDKDRVKTWSDLNPEYRHEVLTDEMMESYVKDHFHTSRPDIEQIYFEVKDYILRSDLIRYLILLADGGVYNDLDVGCEKPIESWVPPQFKDSAGILLGVEVDNKYGPDGRTFKGGQDLFQLVNWTIMSKPNQPFMWFLVERVLNNIKNLAASQDQPISQMTYSVQDVLNVTGPAALTQAFFDYASNITDSNVTYHNFTKITTPRLIGEVVILPIHAFGAGHQVEWAGWKQTDGTPLVHHYFKGSWKTDHVDKPPQLSSADEEEKEQEQDVKTTGETKGKQAEAVAQGEHAKIAQGVEGKAAEDTKPEETSKAAEEQQKSIIEVAGSSASIMMSPLPSPDASVTTENKPATGQATEGDEEASDKPPSVKYMEDQGTEPNATNNAAAEPESMKDMLAKSKTEKEAKIKADPEEQTNEAAEAAKTLAEQKAKEEARLKAQEDSKSDEEKQEDARKAKERKEEEERKEKWEEVKKAAPKTAPKKTDEEKQKSSNDLTDYDYIPD